MIHALVTINALLITYFMTESLFKAMGGAIGMYIFYFALQIKSNVQMSNLKLRYGASVLFTIIAIVLYLFFKDASNSVIFIYMGIVNLIGIVDRQK